MKLLDAITGKDNATLDMGRILWAGFCVALAGSEFWSLYRGQPFDAMTFASAASALLVAGSGGLALKAHTEPAP